MRAIWSENRLVICISKSVIQYVLLRTFSSELLRAINSETAKRATMLFTLYILKPLFLGGN